MFIAVNSIALVKPGKAKQIEGMLIQMAQRGQIAEKVMWVTPCACTQSLLFKFYFLPYLVVC